MSSGARSRYFTSNGGLCSVKLLSDCGRPASTKATFSPASASRLHTHPPEAPEPTTTVSKEFLDRSPTRRLPRSPRTGDANKQAQARQPQGTATVPRGWSVRGERARSGERTGEAPIGVPDSLSSAIAGGSIMANQEIRGGARL